MQEGKKAGLLPKDALAGIRLSISVSPSPDLLRLGLAETHFRLALAEIARCVLVAGGQLSYGGHLESNGYTAFLMHELERYSRRDRPISVCLAWTEHRKLALSKLEDERRRLGMYGRIVCLDPDGNEIDPALEREEAPPPAADTAMRQQSLTGMRRYMANTTDGRVLIGGKRDGFQGAMPGILEEALISIEQGKPVYVAGGFGGVTSDIASTLGLAKNDWLPVLPEARSDERLIQGLSILTNLIKATEGHSMHNGLSDDEAQRLAVSYRPSEIATLVSLGLGRRFWRND